MRKAFSVVSFLCFACTIAARSGATGDETVPRLGMESSVPRSVEADAKNRLAQARGLSKADSAHSYDVLSYQLNLYFPITTDSLGGTALIRCRSEEDNLDSVYLHLADLTVDSVLVDGSNPSSWNHVAGRLTIHFTTPFSQNDTFQILVGYGGSPSHGYYTTGSGEFRTGYTVTPPSDSRYWFPCWDEPWDKAEEGCEIHAEVPLGFVVGSNGLLTEIDTSYYPSDTTVTYHWVESCPIATYLMCVAIAQYKQILQYYHPGKGDSVEIRHFVYGPDSLLGEVNFAETPDMMAFYVPIFGEYPFEKYGMACVENFGWAGMEHQTMTTIHRNAVMGGWEDIIVHELAHQWWGDMVTCFDWAEVWLNEGFATYSEAMWHEHKYGFHSFVTRMTNYGNDYLYGSYTSHPLYDPPELYEWDLVYTKGAWVLHMLRHMVGDTNYSEILKAYGEKFKYGNATTEDFRGVVDSVMNDTFDYYFQQWVYSAEHPQYKYAWEVEEVGGENYLFNIQVLQTQEYGPLFSMPVDLKLSYPGGDTAFTVWVWAQTFQEIQVPLTLPAGVTLFYFAFDPDNWLLDEHEEVAHMAVNVVSTSPTQNELNVPANTDISVTFDCHMDETTINDSTFVVNARSTGLHQGTVTYDSLTKTATLDPGEDFDVGEVVTAVLTTDIQSSDNVPLSRSYSWSFSVMSIDGPGIFVLDSVYSAGNEPISVFPADLDGDGDPDLAVSNDSLCAVSIFVNNGDGTFASDSSYPVSSPALSVFAADLDGDGDLDLATPGYYAVSILLNNGDGTFAPYSDYGVHGAPRSIFAADLDGDGDVDITTANFWPHMHGLSILMNNGDGTFAADSTYKSPKAWSVCAGDLDGDGDLDLATAASYSVNANVSVFSNNGDGTFALDSVYEDHGVEGVFAADLDGDGDLDLATLDPDDYLGVLLNNGDGTFAADSVYPVGEGPTSVFAADLDGDGDPDLITPNRGSDDISVLLNYGDGTYAPDSVYPVGSFPMSVFAADFDGDGDLDLAVANYESDNVFVLMNGRAFVCGDCNGDGGITFADALYIKNYYYQTPPGSPAPIGQGDVNLDGTITFADALYIKNYYYQTPPGSPAPCNPPLTTIPFDKNRIVR